MKLWISSTLLFALINPAYAEDVAVDTYASPQMDIYAAAEAPAPVVVAPQPITMPGLSREDTAALHLSILRDEVDNMTQVGFFGSLFAANEELQQALTQDIELFLAVYSDLSLTAEAMQLKGDMLSKQHHPEAAAVAYLQTMYEFPKTDAARQAKQKVKDILEKDWDDYADDVRATLQAVPNAGVADRLRSLINQLYPINDKDLVAALTLLQLDFLKRFSDDAHADEVQILLAHNMGAESAEAGVFGFKKLLALYPNSSYRPEAMLAIADLQRTRLKAYEKAEQNYKVLIDTYPEHKLTKNAYEHLALTQAEDLKKYPQSIATYSKIVALYPDDKISLLALQHKAKLQERKTDEPRKAVATLRQLATMFHGFEATDALEDAISIARKKLKDDKLLFEVRQQLVNDYPNSDAAPKALFNMAESTNDTALYGQFLKQYPDHKLAKKVREKLQPSR